MALDTKQKRGSVLELAMPFREWLAEPTGTVDASERASLVKLSSAVPLGAPSAGGSGAANPIFDYLLMPG